MKKKTWILAGLGIALITIIGASVDTYHDYRQERQKQAHYEALIPLIDIPKNANTTETADIVREFINSNSIHMVSDDDPKFFGIWGNDEAISQKIAAFSKDNTIAPVHLECSSRSAIMRMILEALDIRVRTIVLYTHRKDFYSHVFLEVQDKETKDWHIQDPGYDLFWQDSNTQKRLSTIDIVDQGTNNVLPCHTPEDCRWGWHNKGSQGNPGGLKRYFGLAVIKDKIEDTRDLYYNDSTFPLNEPQEVSGKGNLTFCEFEDKNCRGKIVQLGNKTDTL